MLTTGEGDLGDAIAEARLAGVKPHQLAAAGYINFGFNVINRTADAFGVALPDESDLKAAATVLLSTGYRALSGSPFAWHRRGATADLQRTCVDELATAALAPGCALPVPTREALYLGNGRGVIGEFGRKVEGCASRITSQDVLTLRDHGHSEDAIFEATICAALGASTRRLDGVLQSLKVSAGR